MTDSLQQMRYLTGTGTGAGVVLLLCGVCVYLKSDLNPLAPALKTYKERRQRDTDTYRSIVD